MRHDFADFAILAFFERDGKPRIGAALRAFHPGFDGPVSHAVNRDALREPGKTGGIYGAMHAHPVATLQGIRRQFEISRQAAIVREQQQAFAVQVQPADADHARKVPAANGQRRSHALFRRARWSPDRRACDTRTGAALQTAGNGLPSTTILSSGPTVKAGESSIFPLTLTRPSRIHRSASRREHSPARAMTLAMRSSSWPLSMPEGNNRSGDNRRQVDAKSLSAAFSGTGPPPTSGRA